MFGSNGKQRQIDRLSLSCSSPLAPIRCAVASFRLRASTPLPSRQNAGISISFGLWMAVGVPFTIVGVLLAWILICVVTDPTDVGQIPVIVYSKRNVLSRKNVFIVGLTLLTIFGWSTFSSTEDLFGDLGVIALLFIVVAFGSGILSEVTTSPRCRTKPAPRAAFSCNADDGCISPLCHGDYLCESCAEGVSPLFVGWPRGTGLRIAVDAHEDETTAA